ncbi:MAG: hypothetical protein WCR21_13590 [Bacteroidota bacterium]
MRPIVILLCLGFSWQLNAQTKPKQSAAFTIRGNVGIPKAITSKLFSTCFTGVVESNLSANVRLFQNFYAGIGYQNSFFQNNKLIFLNQVTAKAAIPYDTKLMINSGFLKIGYDQFFSDIGYFSYALNAGYSFAGYKNVIRDSSLKNQPFVGKNFSGAFVQPEFSVNFIAEDLLSFSLMISYNNLLYHFDPKAPHLAHFQAASDLVQGHHNKYIMSWINFGFGFNILIN